MALAMAMALFIGALRLSELISPLVLVHSILRDDMNTAIERTSLATSFSLVVYLWLSLSLSLFLTPNELALLFLCDISRRLLRSSLMWCDMMCCVMLTDCIDPVTYWICLWFESIRSMSIWIDWDWHLWLWLVSYWAMTVSVTVRGCDYGHVMFVSPCLSVCAP